MRRISLSQILFVLVIGAFAGYAYGTGLIQLNGWHLPTFNWQHSPVIAAVPSEQTGTFTDLVPADQQQPAVVTNDQQFVGPQPVASIPNESAQVDPAPTVVVISEPPERQLSLQDWLRSDLADGPNISVSTPSLLNGQMIVEFTTANGFKAKADLTPIANMYKGNPGDVSTFGLCDKMPEGVINLPVGVNNQSQLVCISGFSG